VISYFSLASGYLTGKYRTEKDLNQRPRAGEVTKYLTERGRRILGALDEVSTQLVATQAQIALAWLIARPSVTAPIASATSVAQLNDLIKATQIKLDTNVIDLLNTASD
jgi:aryl-alcohol dehydrogenase-like predicted oxidoreductase